jgi:hypothetical protein
VRVDFYQLAGAPVDEVVASLGAKIVESGERLLVVMADEGALARLDRLLWDQGKPTSWRTASPARARMRVSRSCCRPRPIPATAHATCW